MATREIDLRGAPKAFFVDLNGTTYAMRVFWVDGVEGGWTLDVGDAASNPLLRGIAMTPMVDLLAQFAYLAIGGLGCKMWLYSDGDSARPAGFRDLGRTSHLVYTVVG